MNIELHDYWRSSAAWRVRIALNLKKLDYAQSAHDLRRGQQREPAYLAIAPQGLIPAIASEGAVITQSLAILEWLEERFPQPPLLPADPAARAVVRSMALTVACDIHPLNNLRVLETLRKDHAADDAAVNAWISRWIGQGFSALEATIEQHGGLCAFGDRLTFADCCIVPQVYGARRFNVSLAAFPRVLAVAEFCSQLPAFVRAHPSAQPDAD